MNMLQTATAWLNKQRNDYLSEPIEFIHFADESRQSYKLIATRGRTIFKAETDYGITIRVHSTDFLVSSDLLPIVPEKGDEIICKGKIYEVLAPNDEPVWRWSGLNEETMRIHTKEIGYDVNAK
jgi:hypothetical protein